MKFIQRTLAIGTSIVGNAGWILPSAAFAQGGVPEPRIRTAEDFYGVVCDIADYMVWLLIVLSIVMAIYAGFLYLTSAGDSEKVKKATRTLTYVAVALAVAFMAFVVPDLVYNFLTGRRGVGTPCEG